RLLGVADPRRLTGPARLGRGPQVDGAGAGPDGEHGVDAELCGVLADRLVLVRTAVAELTHLAEYGDRSTLVPAADVDQRGEGRAHAVGVGVVGVIEHGDAGRTRHELHPPARSRHDVTQRLQRLLPADTAGERDAGR